MAEKKVVDWLGQIQPKKVEKPAIVSSKPAQESVSNLSFKPSLFSESASTMYSSTVVFPSFIDRPPVTPAVKTALTSSMSVSSPGSSKSAISQRLTYSSLTDFSMAPSYSSNHSKQKGDKEEDSEKHGEMFESEKEEENKPEPKVIHTKHGLFIDSPSPTMSEGEEDIDAFQKVKMYYRKPVFLPTSKKYLYRYKKQMSYFSEQMAQDQNNVQCITDFMYKQKCGRYAECKARLLEKLPQPDPLVAVTSMAFTNSLQYLGIGYAGGVFKVMNLEERTLFSPLPEGRRSKILCVRSFPSLTELMFVGSTRRGIILVCKYENPIWRTWEYGQEINNEINAFDFNASGARIVTGGQDCTLRVYDFQSGKMVNEYKRYSLDTDRLIGLYDHNLEDQEDGHFRRIHAIKFIDDDENIFLSGGVDNSVKVWDLRVPDSSVQNIYGPHICGDALDVLENKILTGQWTHCRSLEIWDLRTSRKLQALTPKNRGQLLTNEFTYCCKFLRGWDNTSLPRAHGDLLAAGGSGYGALEILSQDYNSILHRFLEPGHIVTLAQAEDFIAYGTTSNVLGLCAFFPKRSADEPDRLQETYEQLQAWTEKYGLEIDKYVADANQETRSEDMRSSTSFSHTSVKEEQEEDKLEEEEHVEDYALDFIETTQNIDDEDESFMNLKNMAEVLKELSASDYGDSDITDYDAFEHSGSSRNSFFKFPLDAEFLKCPETKDKDETLFPKDKKFKQKQMRHKKIKLIKRGKK